jgi:hypothetical protein
MDPIPTPTITVSFAIDLDLKYDPFKGKSPMEFAALIEDDLSDLLLDLRPEMLGAFTSITAVQEHNA